MLSPMKSAALVLVAASSLMGCAGIGQTAMVDREPSANATLLEAASAQPDMVAPATDVLPAAITQTLHTNGMFWVGFSGLTANNGDLDVYDAGNGIMLGVAFGNENVKSFFELTYVDSKGHDAFGETGAGGWDKIGSGVLRSTYAGLRRYLRPVTGQSGRVVPFLVAGLSYHTLDNYPVNPAGAAAAPTARLDYASGMGVYGGTGVELYLSAQLTLGMDVRGSYWNWQGQPEATGENGTVSATVSLYYHF